MPSVPKVTARTFYLNEQHELSRGEKSGGGRIPQYVNIDWASKGRQISQSLQRGLGVWGLTGAAVWEDRYGTSFAAPLLAREAAFIFELLQAVCQQGARPYAVTVKAFLALTALPSSVSGAALHLAERTLARGRASADRLYRPRVDTAVMLWQGVLEGHEDIARIKIPIPKKWYGQAAQPKLRLVVTWDPPANAAASGLWTTRKVLAHLKQSPESKSIHGSRSGQESHPWIDRTYIFGRAWATLRLMETPGCWNSRTNRSLTTIQGSPSTRSSASHSPRKFLTPGSSLSTHNRSSNHCLWRTRWCVSAFRPGS